MKARKFYKNTNSSIERGTRGTKWWYNKKNRNYLDKENDDDKIRGFENLYQALCIPIRTLLPKLCQGDNTHLWLVTTKGSRTHTRWWVMVLLEIILVPTGVQGLYATNWGALSPYDHFSNPPQAWIAINSVGVIDGITNSNPEMKTLSLLRWKTSRTKSRRLKSGNMWFSCLCSFS